MESAPHKQTSRPGGAEFSHVGESLPAVRPARFGKASLLLSGQRADFWAVSSPLDRTPLDAALCVRHRIEGLTTIFDLIVHPAWQGQLEAPLIHYLLRHLISRRQSLVTDHPADDPAGSAVLRANHFRAERTLTHMIWHPSPKGDNR